MKMDDSEIFFPMLERRRSRESFYVVRRVNSVFVSPSLTWSPYDRPLNRAHLILSANFWLVCQAV